MPIDAQQKNDLNDLAKMAIASAMSKITELVFDEIRLDSELKAKYESLESSLGKNTLHQQLGKIVKKQLSSKNEGRSSSGSGKLIKSYTKHS